MNMRFKESCAVLAAAASLTACTTFEGGQNTESIDDRPVVTDQPGVHASQNILTGSRTISVDPAELPQLDDKVRKKIFRSIVKISGIDYAGKIEYSGSGFMIGETGKHADSPVIATAGHVLAPVDPSTVKVEDQNYGIHQPHGNEDMLLISYDHKRTTASEPLETVTTDVAKIDDIGILHLGAPVDKQIPALQPRDMKHKPLMLGEVVWFVNFQNDRDVHNPVAFPGLFAGHGQSEFSSFVDNVNPLQTEDQLDPGGSGGVVVDQAGDVIGVSVSNIPGYYKCDEAVSVLNWNQKTGNYAQGDYLQIAGSAGECTDGLGNDSVRLVNADGSFDFAGRE